MAADVEDQLVSTLRVTKFSLQIDESTIRNNEALLMAYVRFVDDQNTKEEMLFAKCLPTDTRGESIFQTVKDYFDDKDIPLQNIISCASDGAASMTGRVRGFLSRLKEVVPDLITVHCVLHRQNLASKNLSSPLHEILTKVIKAVNYIKANSLRDRIFQQMCGEDEVHNRLLMHTEVRWLSRGQCLTRFVELYDKVMESVSEELQASLKKPSVHRQISYLADIFSRINDANLQLQGKGSTLIDAKRIISALIEKLQLFRGNLARRYYQQFSLLASSIRKYNEEPSDQELREYADHMTQLITDLQSRFADLVSMNVPVWIISLSSTDPSSVPEALQEEIIDAKIDEELKVALAHSYANAWLHHAQLRYPELHKTAQRLLLPFPTSYLVESAFSHVISILSKQRNRLDITARGDLRLKLTTISPRVQALAENVQAQGSH